MSVILSGGTPRTWCAAHCVILSGGTPRTWCAACAVEGRRTGV